MYVCLCVCELTISLNQGLANFRHAFVKKVLLEHSCVHLLPIVYYYFCATNCGAEKL